ARRDVPVRGAGLFRDLLCGLAAGAAAAEPHRHHPVRFTPAMITLSHVSKWYQTFQVLKDCSTEVAKGEVVVVCGPSGSGRSTLIKCVNGLEPFDQGEILIEGTSVGDKKTKLPKLRARVGMVFQHFELFPHLSVLQNLTIAQCRVLKRGAGEAEGKAFRLLDLGGLRAHAPKVPAQLSGGQQQ